MGDLLAERGEGLPPVARGKAAAEAGGRELLAPEESPASRLES
jgi:hypothetical protein